MHLHRFLGRLAPAAPTALWALAALFAALPALAQRPYEPPYTIERTVMKYVVAADGSYAQTIDHRLRINTPQAVEGGGSAEISYGSSQEAMHKVEAWTILPDGTEVPVLPAAIRDRDEDNSGGRAEFSDTRYKVVVFPQAEFRDEVVELVGAVGVIVLRVEHRLKLDEVAEAHHAVEVNADIFPQVERADLVHDGEDAERVAEAQHAVADFFQIGRAHV